MTSGMCQELAKRVHGSVIFDVVYVVVTSNLGLETGL